MYIMRSTYMYYCCQYYVRWRINNSNSVTDNSTFNFTPEKSKVILSFVHSKAPYLGI